MKVKKKTYQLTADWKSGPDETMRLWAFNSQEEVTAWRKPCSGWAGFPSAMLCLFVCALPYFVEGNNEPACLKFFLPLCIMVCFISFHLERRVGKRHWWPTWESSLFPKMWRPEEGRRGVSRQEGCSVREEERRCRLLQPGLWTIGPYIVFRWVEKSKTEWEDSSKLQVWSMDQQLHRACEKGTAQQSR